MQYEISPGIRNSEPIGFVRTPIAAIPNPHIHKRSRTGFYLAKDLWEFNTTPPYIKHICSDMEGSLMLAKAVLLLHPPHTRAIITLRAIKLVAHIRRAAGAVIPPDNPARRTVHVSFSPSLYRLGSPMPMPYVLRTTLWSTLVVDARVALAHLLLAFQTMLEDKQRIWRHPSGRTSTG